MAMGGAKIMWKYVKSLEYPVNIKKKDLRMAKYLVTQYGGANGELAAAFRYLNQRYTMPDDKGKALLTDIGTEELAHVEMISAMIYQLLNGATLKELKEAGLESHYAEHGYGLYPTDSNGVPLPYHILQQPETHSPTYQKIWQQNKKLELLMKT